MTWRKDPHDPRQGWAWVKLRAAVLKRDQHQCQLRRPGCTGRATTADHITPVARGGATVLSNLRASCRACNQAAMFALQGKRPRPRVDPTTGLPIGNHWWNERRTRQ